jgi:hypothetical protein
MRPSISHRSIVAMIGLAFLALAGCGPQVGTVQGKVTYRGKVVPGGVVVLLTSDNQAIHCPIDKDGSYTAPNIRCGPARFVVLNPPPPVVGAGEPLPPTRDFLPKRFENPDEVNLSLNVQPGLQTFNLDLK